MNLADLTLRCAVLKVLADEIAERLKEAKLEALAAFTATGTTQARPALPDGTVVATASACGATGKSASVTNPDAFVAWVMENYPGEIEVKVRDSFKTKVLAAAKSAGRPVDPATGQVVPGVRVGPPVPYVSVRPQAGSHAAIAAAWRAGELTGIELVAPPAVERGAA